MSSYNRNCPERGVSYPTGAVRRGNGHDLPKMSEKPFKPRSEAMVGAETVFSGIFKISTGFAIVLAFIWVYARYRMYAASLDLDFQEFAEAAQFLGFLSTAIPGLLVAAGIAFAIRFAIRKFRDQAKP